MQSLAQAADAVCTLDESESHHASHVLRLKVGATVELFDGNGATATATIESIGKSQVRVALSQSPVIESRSQPLVTLAFAVPKGKRLDWLLEKATELGAAALLPVVCRRSVAGEESLSDNKRQRWLTHCVAAAKQSGLNFLPEIAEPLELPQLLDRAANGNWQILLAGMTDPSAPPLATTLHRARQSAATGEPASRILILVGPEGGFTDDELSAIKSAGFSGVRLGHTTLRIETAAVALLAAVTAMWD